MAGLLAIQGKGMGICTLCSKDFVVSNMVEAALKSYATFEDP
jgi:hypothetical protein